MKQKFAMWFVMVIVALGAAIPANALEFTLEDLRNGVKTANDDCPEDMGDGLTLALVELDEDAKTLDYYIHIESDEISVNLIESYKPIFTDTMREAFIDNDDEEQRAMIRALKKYGYGMNFIFFEDADNLSIISFEPEDL